ncbi:hypothetical protein [Cetobacterium sp.]|uniref:hypothetical protein n=1 Tax=Cetobacterium sp. TaxID=2071632 RepID=UPI003F2FAA6D
MKRFNIIAAILKEIRLKGLSEERIAKQIGITKIELTELFLEKKIDVELLEKLIEVVFESYEFQYSFKENPLKNFSTKDLLEELMRRENLAIRSIEKEKTK